MKKREKKSEERKRAVSFDSGGNKVAIMPEKGSAIFSLDYLEDFFSEKLNDPEILKFLSAEVFDPNMVEQFISYFTQAAERFCHLKNIEGKKDLSEITLCLFKVIDGLMVENSGINFNQNALAAVYEKMIVQSRGAEDLQNFIVSERFGEMERYAKEEACVVNGNAMKQAFRPAISPPSPAKTPIVGAGGIVEKLNRAMESGSLKVTNL